MLIEKNYHNRLYPPNCAPKVEVNYPQETTTLTETTPPVNIKILGHDIPYQHLVVAGLAINALLLIIISRKL
jgi:hypothetical protein